MFQRGRHLLQTDVSLFGFCKCWHASPFGISILRMLKLPFNQFHQGSSYWQNTCIEYMHRRAEDRGEIFSAFPLYNPHFKISILTVPSMWSIIKGPEKFFWWYPHFVFPNPSIWQSVRGCIFLFIVGCPVRRFSGDSAPQKHRYSYNGSSPDDW